ncbi:MAG: substrate-binding domain-containing protein, partial [Kofleriaceae bacterium]
MKLERNAAKQGRRIDLNAWAMAGVLAVMWIVLTLLPATGGAFLSAGNIATLLTQYSVLLVVAVGMTLVILIRGIDLSVGAGVALTGVIAAIAQTKLGLSAPWAILAALVAGAALGAWHGYWAAWLGVPAFIVTLAGFKAYRGGALVMSNATSLQMDPDFSVLDATLPACAAWLIVGAVLAIGLAVTFREARRRAAFGLPVETKLVAIRMIGQVLLATLILAVFGSRGLPVPVLVAGAVALAGVFVTRKTRFGRHLYAIGGNPEAARLSGIAVKRVTLAVYVIMGVLTAVAGLLAAARINSVTASNQGYMLELDAVTAVVIGGTSIAGGRGSVAGTVLGTLVFATLANGMSLLGIDSNWQLIFTGMILLVAVLVDRVVKGELRNTRSLKLVLAALGLAVIAVIAYATLSSSKQPAPDVAFLLSTLAEERYQKDVRYFEAHAAKLGLRSVVFAADNDNAKQLAQVEDALTLGAKVLVIQPTDSKSAASYLAIAHARGAKVIAYDRTIASPELDYYVSHDSYRVGVLQAKAAIAATAGKGKFVILSGQSGHSVANEITRGYDDTLAPYVARGDIEIVVRQSHSAWAPEQALRTVEDAITRFGRIDAILANNSGMARGAVQAVTREKLAHVFIAGADADAANVGMVCEGTQSIEVLKDIQPLAETAADVAKQMLDG